MISQLTTPTPSILASAEIPCKLCSKGENVIKSFLIGLKERDAPVSITIGILSEFLALIRNADGDAPSGTKEEYRAD